MSAPILRLTALQRPVFLVNSRMGLFTATLSSSTGEPLHSTRVPLLPKLRGDFAEFLSESYLAHLSILYQPTCGGFRYGYLLISSAKLFLAVWIQQLPLRRESYSIPQFITNERIFLPILPTYLYSHFQSAACLSSCVPPPLLTINR